MLPQNKGWAIDEGQQECVEAHAKKQICCRASLPATTNTNTTHGHNVFPVHCLLRLCIVHPRLSPRPRVGRQHRLLTEALCRNFRIFLFTVVCEPVVGRHWLGPRETVEARKRVTSKTLVMSRPLQGQHYPWPVIVLLCTVLHGTPEDVRAHVDPPQPIHSGDARDEVIN